MPAIQTWVRECEKSMRYSRERRAKAAAHKKPTADFLMGLGIVVFVAAFWALFIFGLIAVFG